MNFRALIHSHNYHLTNNKGIAVSEMLPAIPLGGRISLQKIKQLRNIFLSIALSGLFYLTGCNDETNRTQSESTPTSDTTVATEVSSTDTTTVSCYYNSDKNTDVSVSRNTDTVTTTSAKTTEINQSTDTVKTTETGMKENQPAEATDKTGTSSPHSDQKAPVSDTSASNTTIQKTETTSVTLPSNEEQVTRKRDENELPGIDPFA